MNFYKNLQVIIKNQGYRVEILDLDTLRREKGSFQSNMYIVSITYTHLSYKIKMIESTKLQNKL